MLTRTVVVAPSGVLAESVLARLVQWSGAGLVREFIWLTPTDWDAADASHVPTRVRPLYVTGRVVRRGGSERRADLLSWLGESQPSLVRVLAVQLLDSAESADLPLVTRAEELPKRLGPALVAESEPGGTPTRSVAVSLLVPAAGVVGVPRDVLMRGGWTTVVASPEDRSSPRRMGTIVVNPGRYESHAALHVASAGGLWVAQPDGWGPFDDGPAPSGGRPLVRATRVFNRVLQANEVVYEVASEALATRHGHWSPPVAHLQAVVTPNPQALVGRAVKELLGDSLTLDPPVAEAVDSPPTLGWAQAIAHWFRGLLTATASLPRMVARRFNLLAQYLTGAFLVGSRDRAINVSDDLVHRAPVPGETAPLTGELPDAALDQSQSSPGGQRAPALPDADGFIDLPRLRTVPGARPVSGKVFEGADTSSGPDFEDEELVEVHERLEHRIASAAHEVAAEDPVQPDTPVPDLWKRLQAVSFGLIDAGDMPQGVTQPRQGATREVISEPRLISPHPADAFMLSPESLVELERASTEAPAPVPACDPAYAQALGEWLSWHAEQERTPQRTSADEVTVEGPSDGHDDGEGAHQVASGGKAGESEDEAGPFERDLRRLDAWQRQHMPSAYWRIASHVHQQGHRAAELITRAQSWMGEKREDRFVRADRARRRFVDGWMALLCGLPAFVAAIADGLDLIENAVAAWVAAVSWLSWTVLGGSVQPSPEGGTSQAPGGGKGRGDGRWFLRLRFVLAVAYLLILVLVGYQVLSDVWASRAFYVTVGWFALYVLTRARRTWWLPVVVLLGAAIAFLPLYRAGLGEITGTGWFVLAAVVLFFSAWVAVYSDYRREMLQFQRWREKFEVMLGNHVRAAKKGKSEVRRLGSVYRQLVQWCEIIGWVLHQPYEVSGASRDVEVGAQPGGVAGDGDAGHEPGTSSGVETGVSAFQLQHVEISQQGHDEVLANALGVLRSRGWLSNLYTLCSGPYREADASGGGSPESDVSLAHGPRGRLLDDLRRGVARRPATEWALERIENVIEDADPSALLSEIPGDEFADAANFLAELVPSSPYLPIDDGLWTDPGRVRRANTLRRIEVSLPARLSGGGELVDGTDTVRRRTSNVTVQAGVGYSVQATRCDVTGVCDADTMALFATEEWPELPPREQEPDGRW